MNWIFLWRLPIQNHPKPSINEKRRNKPKYLTWNSIWLKFSLQIVRISNPVKSLGYIKCYSLSNPSPVRNSNRPFNLNRSNKGICNACLEKGHFLLVLVTYWLISTSKLVKTISSYYRLREVIGFKPPTKLFGYFSGNIKMRSVNYCW